MRIKTFNNFLNESSKGPEVLNSFEEAESKLSDKDGIVLSGITGDITDVEEAIKAIPHTEAYVLITDQSSQVASAWKSDVFLVGGKKDGETSIKEYFKTNESVNEEYIRKQGKEKIKKMLYKKVDEYIKSLDEYSETADDIFFIKDFAKSSTE